MAQHKISVIGGGYVGEAAMKHLVSREVADVYLFDIVEDMTKGKALDMAQSAALIGYDALSHGVSVDPKGDGSEYAAMEGSEVVIITSGLPRKPGMSRDDLLDINAKIVGGVVDAVVKYAPDSKIIMVTNPLDSMAYVAKLKSGWDRSRVMGMAGALDQARMACFVAEAVNASIMDVRCMVLGGHGDTMVALPRFSTVAGIPITELLPAETIKAICERTAKGGGEIVNLFRNTGGRLGSAYHAPGVGAAIMAESIVRDQRRIIPTAVYCEGEYGYTDMYQGLPAVLGKNGVEKIIELKLNAEEKAALDVSSKHVQTNNEALKRILGL